MKLKRIASNFKDLTGRLFGSWKVIKRSKSKKYTWSTGRIGIVTYWLCKCLSCGLTKSIRGATLLRGDSTRCRKCYGIAQRKFTDKSKFCPWCQRSLPLSEFYDSRSTKSPSKKYGHCKLCTGTLIPHTMSFISYQIIMKKQKGLCAIYGCPRPATKIDHDHSCCPNGKSCGKCTRGILCTVHNSGLGYFQDDPKILKATIHYLENNLFVKV